MKLKLYELFKRYRFAIVIALSIILVGIGVIMLVMDSSYNISIKKFKNKYYSFRYDSSWKIHTSNKDEVILKYSKENSLNIQIVTLKEENKYSSIEDMLDELIFDIETQNKQFKLISKQADDITKNKYPGYKLLYEDDNSQALILLAKKSDKLLIFNYQASNEYFDILLDSVNNIIYEFDTTEEIFDLKHSVEIKKSQITYEKSNIDESLLKNTTEHEIASYNYHVKFSIPDNFKSTLMDSTRASFKFEGLKDGNINLHAYIYNKNIYKELDKEEVFGIYKKWDYYETNKDYSKFKESLDILDAKNESYIYKNSYYYDKAIEFDKNFNSKYTSQINENIVLIYALDKNHILLIEISSSKISIPKKLIEMIKINSKENYSSYITSLKKDGKLISELKRYTDYEKESIDKITLNIPEKYKEIDKNSNIYSNRYYNLNYNDELDVYEYEVEYKLTTTSSKLDGQVELINNTFPKSYGKYEYLKFSSEKQINGKLFKIYDGGYTELGEDLFSDKDRTKYFVNVKTLFYELSNGGYLIINIKGNGSKISNEVLKDLINFEIKK